MEIAFQSPNGDSLDFYYRPGWRHPDQRCLAAEGFSPLTGIHWISTLDQVRWWIVNNQTRFSPLTGIHWISTLG